MAFSFGSHKTAGIVTRQIASTDDIDEAPVPSIIKQEAQASRRRLVAFSILQRKELGWTEIGEEFTRYVILKTPWFQVLVHRLWCPVWHEKSHDHPWWFVAFIFWGGYWEKAVGRPKTWRGVGSLLFRRAEFAHNVTTDGSVNWSIVITGPKRRDWKFVEDEDEA